MTSSHPTSRFDRRAPAVIALVLALLVALLAFWSPVDMSGADPGIALLASQVLLQHGSFDLTRVADDALVSYDLDRDYRIRQYGLGGYFYYSYGVPLLSLPAVALANAAGMDMRRQEDEFWLQNLLSAGVCGLVFLLLYRLLSAFADPLTALVVTTVSTFGSPLVSTLATGLWNAGYQLLFLLGALILLVRRRPTPIVAVSVLVALAALCRPTTAFFAFALMLHLLRTAERRSVRWASALGLSGIALALVLAALDLGAWLPRYYNPLKLFNTGNPLVGTFGLLASPSRGLLVYSPFLAILLLGLVVTARRLWKQPVFQLAVCWIAAHWIAVAFKLTWWGGHAFGPRLLTEIVPAFALVSVLVWRELRTTQRRRLWAFTYLAAGVVAIAIHSGSGLFNPWTVKWNERPNIDVFHDELFNWRYPQFLASEEAVAERYLEVQRRTRLPYVVGEAIESRSRTAVFEGWSAPEGPWRWSRERLATIHLELEEAPGEAEPAPFYLLEIKAGAHGRQQTAWRWNRVEIGSLRFEGFAPQERLLLLPGSLVHTGENRLEISIPNAAPSPNDPRLLGIALRSLRLWPLPSDFAGFDHAAGAFFGPGFSDSEGSWRWTDGPQARISIPLVRPPSAEDPTLRLEVGALGHQEAELFWDGVALNKLEVDGFEPVTIRIPLASELLEVGALHELELRILSPQRAPGDSRQLGLALVSVNLEFWRTGETEVPDK